MLTKSQIREVTELRMKKFRDERRRFVAEGHKLVSDLVESRFTVAGIYAVTEWIRANRSLPEQKGIPVYETTASEMGRISGLCSASPVLAVVEIPHPCPSPMGEPLPVPLPKWGGAGVGLLLALDDIRDPGNLGTIIRIADWFGIGTVLCSENCADTYNPKVIQATMGSIARVSVITCDLVPTLSGSGTPSGWRTPSGCPLPVYGTFPEGIPIYDLPLPSEAIILIGNESRGISGELIPFITHKLSIPSFGPATHGKAESLNASVAAAIVCAEFRRQGAGVGKDPSHL
jgi:TrmH family RNA methyltransferase